MVAFVLLHNSSFNLHCLYTEWSNAYSEISPEVMLQPLATSCVKDYKGHSLVQTSFTKPPNRMPQNAFSPWTHDFLVSQKTMQRHFFSILHPLSLVIFATATVVAFVLLHNSKFNFHCYTQREATPTQKSARKWRCDLSRLLARKITKSIHSCKPASLNCPIVLCSVV